MTVPVSCGCLYRKWHGPMIFAEDGLGIIRLFRHLFGFGLPLGAVNCLFLGFLRPEESILLNLVLAAMALGLSGIQVAGQYFVGSWIGEKLGYS